MVEIVRIDKKLSFDEMLEIFCSAYPKKVKKLWTKKALGKALHEDTFENIIAGVAIYKTSEDVLNGYILDPQNFLSSGSWMDKPSPPKPEKYEWETADQYREKLRKWADDI